MPGSIDSTRRAGLFGRRSSGLRPCALFRRWFMLSICAASMLIGVAGTAAAQDAPEQVLDALFRLRAEVPMDARTARSLGTERLGNGVLIGSDGLILTIGYLILEADEVYVELPDGESIPADIVAYDHPTGFGLVRALAPLDAKPLRLGDSRDLTERSPVLAVRSGGVEAMQPTYVVSRRAFAGYWEYLLDSAIFTSPPIHDWGGAALIGEDGRLLGIGSLLVGDALPAPQLPGNMFVPIDLLKPILADLLDSGRSSQAPRPWIGVYTNEIEDKLIIYRVAEESPARRAGLRLGDVIVAVDERPVDGMADFYRKMWALGDAGVDVPLLVLRDGEPQAVVARSADRHRWLKLTRTY